MRLGGEITEMGLRKIVPLIAALFSLTITACLQVQPQPPVPPTTMSSWGPMGGFSMSSGAACAGQATLSGPSTVVNDACFVGAGDIVMCTDTTAPNAVACTPGAGILTISGASGDTISYAKVR